MNTEQLTGAALDDYLTLTPDEKRAISALKRLAKRWPESLWLFTNGDISILKALPDGSHAHGPDQGIDQDYIVASITGISSDGGDW